LGTFASNKSRVKLAQQSIEDTIVAPATAPGQAAIAVIRLSGKAAISICNACFRGKNLESVAPNTIHFGTIRDGEVIVDEVLVSLFKGPHSYTGEDTVEVSCHGSMFIQQQVLQLFIRHGARSAAPGEFTMRAFLNGKLDLSQAEAVADLIASDSKAAHQIAMHQMRGGFSAEISKLREELIHFASMIELELDFSEEDVEFANRDELKALLLKTHKVAQGLIDSFQVGNVIKNGIPVVIAGKPNAGKSTLLNALLNEERALVSDIAGTTRDTIEDELNLNGVIFRFIDTAGLRDTDDTVEAMGVARTLEKVKQAAVVAYVFDVNELSGSALQAEVEKLQLEMEGSDAQLLLLANKIDAQELSALKEEYSHFPNLIFISAKERQNIEQLTSTLLQLVKIGDIGLQDTIVSNTRHHEALTNANTALMRAYDSLNTGITGDFIAMDIRQSLHYLGEITGEISPDDLLGNIFSKFCIGK